MKTASAGLDADHALLNRNLEALASIDRDLAERLASTAPHPGLVNVDTEEGVPSATLDGIALASKRRPLAEAKRFADAVDLRTAGVAVVLGVGLGYHVAALADRCKDAAAVVAVEPDLPLLRAALERLDLVEHLRRGRLRLLCETDSTAACLKAVKGLEAMVAVGVSLVEHPPSVRRFAGVRDAFGRRFTDVMESVRTHLVTALMQADVTVRNELMNAGHYLTRPGIDDLAGIAKGRPGIVVGAGPSFARNARLLAEPGVRDRCFIVAVQTVLKPLLELGVKPHLVAALDYHEISARFYEGLTPADIEGVTLVAEARANPRILDAFPGDIRVPRDQTLERILGDESESPVVAPREPITQGATVAHLAYYLARHAGCDPVLLVGQDLGFTDGQYYADGAVIHDIWAPELNAFRTVETFEWERIVRGRGQLRRAQDALGRDIYTDAQMLTYITQFERDFAADAAAGLRIIDATEGGVRKQHTVAMTLEQALRETEHTSPADQPPVEIPPARAAGDAPALLEGRRVLGGFASRVAHVAEISRKTGSLLDRVARVQDRPKQANELIDRIYKLRDEVHAQGDAYELVHRLNQAGTLKRFKADRLLTLDSPDLTAIEQQTRQIERDATNVRWLADAADALGSIASGAAAALDGGPKQTGEMTWAIDDTVVARTRQHVYAVMQVFHDGGTLEHATPDASAIAGAIQRLRMCEGLTGIAIVTDHPKRLRAALERHTNTADIRLLDADEDASAREARLAWQRRVARARAVCPHAWRGGLGNLTAYDHSFHAARVRDALARLSADAALIVGPDWVELDHRLCDQIVERFAEAPDRQRLCFSQAAPGHAGVVIARSLVAELAELQTSHGPAAASASIGGLLAYIPTHSRADAIGRAPCVTIPPEQRDRLPSALTPERSLPAHLLIEPGRHDKPTDSLRGAWYTRAADRFGLPAEIATTITPDHVHGLVARVKSWRSAEPTIADRAPLCVTFAGRGGRSWMGDPADHPDLPGLLAAAREAGADWVHIRTDLACELTPKLVEALASCDVVSVDVLAESPETYALLTSSDQLRRVHDNAQHVLDTMREADGPAGLERWLVGRLTRCDEVYQEVERFYDRWMCSTGAAVIDALPAPIPGARIAPLRTPARAARLAALTELCFDAAGSLIEPAQHLPSSGLRAETLDESDWRSLVAHRLAGVRAEPHEDREQSGMTQAPLVIILARAGSAGLPGKNTRPIAGRPCIEWTIEHALAASCNPRVVVSTDCPKASALARHAGVEPVSRPAELATGSAPVDAAARHALTTLGDANSSVVVILYANVPVRPPDLTDRAVDLLRRTGCDSVQSYQSVGKHHPMWTARIGDGGVVQPWEGQTLFNGVYRRQDLAPAFIPDGGVIAVDRCALMLGKKGVPDGPHAFLGVDQRGISTEQGDVIDIDTETDALLADIVLTRRRLAPAVRLGISA